MLCNIILSRHCIPFQIPVKRYGIGIYFYINNWNPHLLQGLDLGISSEQPSHSVGRSLGGHGCGLKEPAPTLIHGGIHLRVLRPFLVSLQGTVLFFCLAVSPLSCLVDGVGHLGFSSLPQWPFVCFMCGGAPWRSLFALSVHAQAFWFVCYIIHLLLWYVLHISLQFYIMVLQA